MGREFDRWIIDVLEDIETAMNARSYHYSSPGLALVRKQLAEEIHSKHGADNINDSANVVQLLAQYFLSEMGGEQTSHHTISP